RAGERDPQGTLREGQVRLQPLSLALFSKKTPPGQYPEITTVQAKTAYLTFDKPIGNWNDMAKAKIVGADLYDKIEIVNNRRKPRKSNDELHVFIPKGPVHYRQQSRLAAGVAREPDVWTDRTVELKDYQSKPNPTLINAEGMELFL